MDWLLWCYDRQQWSNRELVVVDSSPEPWKAPDREDIRVVSVAEVRGVAAKRSLALQEARGDIITWFDDDDWQHPNKVRWLVESLAAGAPYAGAATAWFVSLADLRCTKYQSRSSIIFNSAGFWRDVAREATFNSKQKKGSDSQWMRSLARKYRKGAQKLSQQNMFFWLCHQDNISNPVGKRRFPHAVAELEHAIGEEAWGDTSAELKRLKHRLDERGGVRRGAVSRRPPRRAVLFGGRTGTGTGTGRSRQEAPARSRSRGNGAGGGVEPAGKRVGILSVKDAKRGLWRDMECLVWALDQHSPRRQGACPAELSVFVMSGRSQVGRGGVAETPKVTCRQAVPRGTRFDDWLDEIDVLVVSEHFLPQAFQRAKTKDVKVVYIPNLDWATHGGAARASEGVRRWVDAVKKSGCEVWAKTPMVQETLEAQGVECVLVPWSIPDPVARDRVAKTSGTVRFLMNAGFGGWRGRRGVDLALQAFKLARETCPHIELVLKSIPPAEKVARGGLHRQDGVRVEEGMVARERLAELCAEADAVLYPSRWEGFGLSLLEALHDGLPVIATDGWPMNELVEHGHNGLLVSCRRAGSTRLAPHWECDVKALARRIVEFAESPALRRRMTAPEPGAVAARQNAFVLRVRQQLLGEPIPRIVVFRAKSKPPWRRSEEYIADAYRAHGYEVDVVANESDTGQIKKILGTPHDFVQVSKPGKQLLSLLGSMTHAPLIMWHHDLIDAMQKWFRETAPLVDLCCVPESGRRKLLRQLGAHRSQCVLPGAKVDGDRGPGRRPIELPPPEQSPDIVFIGNSTRRGLRLPVLSELNKHFDVRIHGQQHAWKRLGLPARPAVWSTAAHRVHRQARIALEATRGDDVPHYTSNRLFHACGVGACVIASRYPGMEDHYPKTAVVSFGTAAEAQRVTAELLADDERRTAMRVAAEDHTWRYHTWIDRAAQVLEETMELPLARKIRPTEQKPNPRTVPRAAESRAKQSARRALRAGPLPQPRSRPKPRAGVAQQSSATRFWNARVRKHGARAAVHTGWSEAQFEHGTKEWWSIIDQYLSALLPNGQERVLDYGCGGGRFTAKLAQRGFLVDALDISQEMLAIASAVTHDSARFQLLSPATPLPYQNDTFNAVLMSTVLQCVGDGVIDAVTAELKRVLAHSGAVVLIENTHQNGRRTSPSGHVVFRDPAEYQQLFRGLEVVRHLTVEGERHTVMAGNIET
jgi:glycosyltransferase involved in cell wall biosynthesis/2-polyprenyl-3-methyl-5-hydroxy-6-metoxy-1,4-benzoquinol methylase